MERPKGRGKTRSLAAHREESERAARERAEAEGKAEELRQEAGEPVGEMPPNAPDGAPPEPEEVVIDGPDQLSIFDLGGKQPTRSSMRLTGGKVRIQDGEAFKKGRRVRFSGEAVVYEVAQRDDTDSKTGQVVDAEQVHKARIVDLRVESAS